MHRRKPSTAKPSKTRARRPVSPRSAERPSTPRRPANRALAKARLALASGERTTSSKPSAPAGRARVLCAVSPALADEIGKVCRRLRLRPTCVTDAASLQRLRGRFALVIIEGGISHASPFSQASLQELVTVGHAGLTIDRGLMIDLVDDMWGLQRAYVFHCSTYCRLEFDPRGDLTDACRSRLAAALQDALAMPPYRQVSYYSYVTDAMIHSIVESSQAPLVVLDREKRVWFANLAAQAMFRRPTYLMKGVPIEDLFASRDALPLFQSLADGVRQKLGDAIELRMRARDGKEFDALVVLNRIFSAEIPEGFMAFTLQDITSRKQAERALRESEERYRSLVAAAPAVLYSAEAQTNRYLLFEGAVEQILGRKPEEFSGTPDIGPRLVYPADRSLVAMGFRKGLASLKPFQLEFRIIHGVTGRVVWLQARVVPVTGEDGKLLRQYCVMIDITAQKEAERQKERLAQAIENAGEGIGIWDRNWRLTYGNAALSRIFGWRRREAGLGTSWSACFAGAEIGRHDDVILAVEREGRWKGKMLGRSRGGRTLPLAVTLSRLGPTDGDFLIVGNIRDMSTEETHLAQIRKLTADAATSLEEERARLATELHDELGQALTALNLNVAWLRARMESADPALKERLNEAGDLVTRTLSTVRSLSKSLRPPLLDHQGLLDAIKSHVSEFDQRTGIRCHVRAQPPDLKVGDPYATIAYRILQEALTNVARHSNAASCEVALTLDDACLELRVQDDGRGASATDLAGTQSLGVVGMRERAATVGGTVRVESAPPGGVRVTALLPTKPPRRRRIP